MIDGFGTHPQDIVLIIILMFGFVYVVDELDKQIEELDEQQIESLEGTINAFGSPISWKILLLVLVVVALSGVVIVNWSEGGI